MKIIQKSTETKIYTEARMAHFFTCVVDGCVSQRIWHVKQVEFCFLVLEVINTVL